jgi:hypothetical protein
MLVCARKRMMMAGEKKQTDIDPTIEGKPSKHNASVLYGSRFGR